MPTTTDGTAVSPTILSAAAESDIQTLQDGWQHLLDAFDIQGTNVDRTKRNVRRALLEAYRDIPSLHPWRFYQTPYRINTSAPYGTGTIAYDHTGGANERQVTLTTGTWPSDAAYCRLQISSEWYDVEQRISDTVLVLTAASNPGADVASGTSYNLARATYALPVGFRRICSEVLRSDDSCPLVWVTPEQWLQLRADQSAVGEPAAYTLMASLDELAVVEMELYPPPAAAYGLEFTYDRTPRLMHLFGGNVQYDTGTVAVSGTTVTGTGTSWNSTMEGAVIRFSSSDSAATGLGGSNPYAEQRVITAVGSATSLTINASLTGTYSGKGFSISDPLDVSPQMLTALYLLAEGKWMRLQNRDRKTIEDRMGMYQQALAEAQNSDRRHGDVQSGMMIDALSYEQARNVTVEL